MFNLDSIKRMMSKKQRYQATFTAHNIEYKVIKTLGIGCSCKVKLAYDSSNDDKPIALKLLKSQMDDGLDPWYLCQNEIEIMSQLDHPNVVKQISHGTGIYDCKSKKKQVRFIALEIC